MDVGGYYQLKGARLESCASCKYFLRVGKYPNFPLEGFAGYISEYSDLSVCLVFADEEKVVIPCQPSEMCELYTKKEQS